MQGRINQKREARKLAELQQRFADNVPQRLAWAEPSSVKDLLVDGSCPFCKKTSAFPVLIVTDAGAAPVWGCHFINFGRLCTELNEQISHTCWSYYIERLASIFSSPVTSARLIVRALDMPPIFCPLLVWA